MIMSTWLDRPLTVAGRVMVKTEDGIESRLVNIDEDLLVIRRWPSTCSATSIRKGVQPPDRHAAAVGPRWMPHPDRCAVRGVERPAEDILDRDLQLVTRQQPLALARTVSISSPRASMIWNVPPPRCWPSWTLPRLRQRLRPGVGPV